MASKGFATDKKVFLRRLVALPLVFLLGFLPAVPVVHATDPVTAATLAVTGGQLAAGGLAGEAGAAALAGPVGAVVGLALAACGVSAYVSAQAQAAGKSRSRFVADKLVIWGAQAGYTAEQLYSKIISGISVAVDGTIQLGSETAKIIQQFGNWLISTEGEVIPSISSGGNDGTIDLGSLALPYGLTFTLSDYISGPDNQLGTVYTMSTDAAFVICASGSNYTPYFVCNESFSWTRVLPSGQTGSNSSVSNYNGYYYLTTLTSYNISRFTVLQSNVYNGTIREYLGSLDGAWNPGVTDAADEVFIGSPQSWEANRDVLNPSIDDTPIVLNPDLLNPILDALADGTQATMSITDYIDALQRAFDQALDDVKTGIAQLTDTVTGIQESIAIPDTAVADPTITNPSVTPDTVPIADPSTVDPGAVITGFQFDLTEIFPFCLPFDVYKMLRLLDAEPVAPSYRFQFDVPIPGLPGHSAGSWHFDYTIDLAQFNAVAALLRKLELLSFCIGLAYVTRSMFIRS